MNRRGGPRPWTSSLRAQRAEFACNLGKDRSPIAGARLAEQPHRWIPPRIASLGDPAPILPVQVAQIAVRLREVRGDDDGRLVGQDGAGEVALQITDVRETEVYERDGSAGWRPMLPSARALMEDRRAAARGDDEGAPTVKKPVRARLTDVVPETTYRPTSEALQTPDLRGVPP